MEFTIIQTVSAPLAAVQDALIDPEFIAACSGLPRIGESTLLDEERSDGRVRLRIRRKFTAELSRAVTRVVDPDKLTWVEDVVVDVGAAEASHKIIPDNYGDRLSSTYTTTLTESDGLTTRTARGTMSVRAPLVAGRVERAIVSGLEEYAAGEADLLDEWLS